MPRGRPKSQARVPQSALEQMVYEIGQRLGEALLRGVESASGRPKVGQRAARGAGRPQSAASPKGACVVPSCGRRPIAKGLCATHYRKARRLNLGETLSAAQLADLAQDGRKARFQTKAA